MNWKKFTDKELNEILLNPSLIKIELESRKEKTTNFPIEISDCFINKSEHYTFIYKVDNIIGDKIYYTEICIDRNQIYSDDEIYIEKNEHNFHKMKKHPIHIIEEAQYKCEEYNKEVERLHDKLYSICNGLIENYE